MTAGAAGVIVIVVIRVAAGAAVFLAHFLRLLVFLLVVRMAAASIAPRLAVQVAHHLVNFVHGVFQRFHALPHLRLFPVCVPAASHLAFISFNGVSATYVNMNVPRVLQKSLCGPHPLQVN
jgi:hypothetical protein